MITLSVVVPIFNEEANLPLCIPSMLETLGKTEVEFEIVLVNDNSQDKSKDIVDQFCRKHECIRAVHHSVNKGFGGAIKSGFAIAKGDYILYYPADSILIHTEVQNYLALIKNADVVVGYRRGRPDYTLYRKLNSTVYYILVNLLLGLKLSDVNWVHMYRKKVLRTITAESNHIFFCAEMLIKAMNKGFIITGVDVTYFPRKHGKETGSSLKTVLRTFLELMSYWLKQILFKSPKP